MLVAVALPAAIALWQPLRVVDGDTVDYGYWRWRLAGFDAPEIRQAHCPEERALGQRAAERLRSLVETRTPRLAYLGDPDKYRRPLGRLTLSGEDVAAIAIREGWGHAYSGKDVRESWCTGYRHTESHTVPDANKTSPSAGAPRL